MPKKYKDLECARCGNFSHQQTTLVGGYNTNLCADCRNAWDRFVADQPEYKALIDLRMQIMMLVSRTQSDGADRLDEIRRLSELETMNASLLFDLGEAWVNKTTEAQP